MIGFTHTDPVSIKPHVVSHDVHSSNVEYVGHVGLLASLSFGIRVVVRDVVGRLAGRPGVGRSDVLVVPQRAPAASALQHGSEAAAELLVEERVQHGVNTTVGRAQPLCDRRGHGQEVLLPGH